MLPALVTLLQIEAALQQFAEEIGAEGAEPVMEEALRAALVRIGMDRPDEFVRGLQRLSAALRRARTRSLLSVHVRFQPSLLR